MSDRETVFRAVIREEVRDALAAAIPDLAAELLDQFEFFDRRRRELEEAADAHLYPARPLAEWIEAKYGRPSRTNAKAYMNLWRWRTQRNRPTRKTAEDVICECGGDPADLPTPEALQAAVEGEAA